MKRNLTASVAIVLAGLLILACLAGLAQGKGTYEWVGGKWVELPKPGEGGPGGDLSRIRVWFDQNKFRKVVKYVKQFNKKYPDAGEREEAMFLAGRAQKQRGLYFQAYEWFKKQLEEHPAGKYSTRAMKEEYNVADAFLKGKKRLFWKIFYLPAQDEGLDILAKIPEQAPNTQIADDAMIRIADYHYWKKDFTEAAAAYSRYVEMFGKSARTPYAMLQSARSFYQSYKGVDYDNTPLIESRQKYNFFAESFPDDAAKAGITDRLKQIDEDLAASDYTVAKFYRRVGRSNAEAFYYRKIIEKYPDTKYAALSQGDLDTMGQGRNKVIDSPTPAGTQTQ